MAIFARSPRSPVKADAAIRTKVHRNTCVHSLRKFTATTTRFATAASIARCSAGTTSDMTLMRWLVWHPRTATMLTILLVGIVAALLLGP